MLSLITGGQRAGKTFFCVTLLVDFLKHTKCHIFTNLPVQPDVLADYACGGRLRFPALYRAYLRRIHIFTSFRGKKRAELRYFKANNPDFLTLYHGFIRQSDSDREAGRVCPSHLRPLLDISLLSEFWRHIQPNSVIMLDEIYQFFGTLDQNLAAKLELRKEMLTYSRQHGHQKDELYLISHDKNDIDSKLRAGVQYIYEVSNSKYVNMFKCELLRGIRYPIQFFWVRGWNKGDSPDCPSDSYAVHPDKRIFQCYDSFARPETLALTAAEEEAVSMDTGVDNKRMFRQFLAQFFPLFCLVVGGVVFFIGIIYFFLSQFSSTSTTTAPTKSITAQNAAVSSVSGATAVPRVSSASIVLVTPSKVVYSDGLTINKGDLINDTSIEYISKNSCGVRRGGNYFAVPLARLRAEVLPREEPAAVSPAGQASAFVTGQSTAAASAIAVSGSAGAQSSGISAESAIKSTNEARFNNPSAGRSAGQAGFRSGR